MAQSTKLTKVGYPPAVPAVKRGYHPRKKSISKKDRERMDDVSSMLSKCVPMSTMVKQLADKWKVKRESVQRYINMVRDEWATWSNLPNYQNVQRDMLRENWQLLILRASTQQPPDLKTIAYALKELGHLDGAYAPKSVQVNAQVAQVGIQLGALGFKDADEVKRRIAELQERIAQGGASALMMAGGPMAAMARPVVDVAVQEALDAEEDE